MMKPPSDPEKETVLEVRDLVTKFYTYQGVVQALDQVNFTIRKGETFGLVGETGCGKSVTALSIMRLIPSPPGRIEEGEVLFGIPPEKRDKIESLELRLRQQLGGPENPVNHLSREIAAKVPNLSFLRSLRTVVGTPLALPDMKRREIDGIAEELMLLKSQYDILSTSEERMRKVRGNLISMIFQEPLSALNPVFIIGDQIAENIMLHRKRELCEAVLADPEVRTLRKRYCKMAMEAEGLERSLSNLTYQWTETRGQLASASKSATSPETIRSLKEKLRVLEEKITRTKLSFFRKRTQVQVLERIPILRRILMKPIKVEALRRAVDILRLVRIPDPERIINQYPFELSGGMAQRSMIAMALSCNPRLLIADEPTTAVDVTIQAQVLKLMKDLKQEVGSSIMLITHNLGVVAETCDRVGVMYAGVVVEVGPTRSIFKEPLHPYTQGLMEAIPKVTEEKEKLKIIKGTVPNLINPPSGCRFHPRCPLARQVCQDEKPRMMEIKPDHFVACHYYGGAFGA